VTVGAVPFRRSFPLSVLAGLCVLSVGGCSSSTQVVVVERPAASVAPSPPSEVSASFLRSSLARFLAAVRTGRPVDLLLAGDRFVVVTPSSFLEVISSRAAGDLRALPAGDCPGSCDVVLGDVFDALAEDVASSPPLLVAAAAPLESWPTLLVASPSRRWHVSFSKDGRGLFVVELLSGSF